MGVDPYTSGMITAPPDFPHSPVEGSLVAVLQALRDERGLRLIPQRTRCVRVRDIHEMLMTDETDAQPGSTIMRVASIGFVEITRGGVLVEGDVLRWQQRSIGVIVGFDETHAPNHMNIVVRAAARASGSQLGMCLGDGIVFAVPRRQDAEDKRD